MVSDTWKEKIIVHEIGHALKLKHPHADVSPENPGFYPIAVMCQGVHEPEMFIKERAVVRPTGHDKAALKEKWG
jgi:hypothetical protein